MTKQDFSAIQLAWVNVLSHPAMADVLDDAAKSDSSALRTTDATADAASLFAARGIALDPKTKASLVAASGPDPVGVRICITDDNNKFHCLTIRSPFQNPFELD